MWWCWRWFWLKQKRCGGGADIKTIKYCGGDGGAMIEQWKCVGGVDSSGKQQKSGGEVRLLLSRQNESADEYFIQVLVKQLKKSHSLTQQTKKLVQRAKQPKNSTCPYLNEIRISFMS